jgi:phage gp36-like protein
MAYSDKDDLLVGDITISEGTKARFVEDAAKEMDASLASAYLLPLSPIPPAVALPEYSILSLERTSNLIASGRLLMDRAAGGEDTALHAYGLSLLTEGQMLLRSLVAGTITLPALRIPEQATASNAPSLVNFDAYSGVDAFYEFATDPYAVSVPYGGWRPGAMP